MINVVFSLAYLGPCRLLALVATLRRGGAGKDVELVALRHQLRVLERQAHGRAKYRPVDRALLAALSQLLPRDRGAGRREWRAWRRQRGPGRPRLSAGLVELIVRSGREDRSWGYLRTQGELAKPGARAGAASARRALRHHGLGPSPRRGPTWAESLKARAAGILATGPFSVGTVLSKRLYVLFATGHATRRAHLLGATGHPGNGLATQAARNLASDLAGTGRRTKSLTRDRGTKFTASPGEASRPGGAGVIKAPVRSPRADAYREGSYAPFARSAWAGWSCSGGGTLAQCFASTSATATGHARTVAPGSGCQLAGLRPRGTPPSRSLGTTWLAGSSTGTGQSRHSLRPACGGPAAPGRCTGERRRPVRSCGPHRRGAPSTLASPAPQPLRAVTPAGDRRFVRNSHFGALQLATGLDCRGD